MAKKIIRKKRREEENPILVRMRQRHYQILVHSFLYYELDENLISDHKFDLFSREMGELVKSHPECLDELEHGYEFRGFTGGSGYYLNYKKPRIVNKALQLLLWSGKPLSDKALNYLDRKTKNYYDKSIKQEEETPQCQQHLKKRPLKKRPLRKPLPKRPLRKK